MKLVHLGDLHIGKRVNEFSMIDDQKYILNQIIEISKSNSVDGIMIAGDIYDKAVPTAEAVELFDSFLTSITDLNIPCIAISGNHDSAERIAFGADIMAKQNVFMSKTFNGKLNKVKLADQFGEINIYMMPFLRPVNVRRFFADDTIEIGSYQDAIKCVLSNMEINMNARNVLIAHQYVTAGAEKPETCDSEIFSVGGVDNVDFSVFDSFDYVALGHIHGQQRIGRDTVRYCGSPLKYSFSEINHKNSVTLIELKEKGIIDIQKIPLLPLHGMREIKGDIDLLLSDEYIAENDININDYMHIILTNSAVMDAMGKVSSVYPNVMQLDFENQFTNSNITISSRLEQKDELEIFTDFFNLQSEFELDDTQKQIMAEIINQCKGAI